MGATALGDYAWAFEGLLNQVLNKQLPISTELLTHIETSTQFLQENQQQFLVDNYLDESSQSELTTIQKDLMNNAISNSVEIDTSTETSNLSNITLHELQSLDSVEYVNNIEPVRPLVDEPSSHLIKMKDELIVEQGDLEKEEGRVKEEVLEKELTEVEILSQNVEDTETEISNTILKLFQSDLPELLEHLDDAMLTVHHEPESQQNISELERQLHTIKGGARMVDAQELADISHNAETLLNNIRSGVQIMDVATIDILQTAIDKIQNLSEALLLEEKAILPAVIQEKVKPAIKTFHFDVAKPKEGYRSLLEQVLSEQKESLPEISVIENSVGMHEASIPEALSSTRETIRLPAVMIDKMVGLSTEININQTQLTEHLQHFDADIDELMMTATRLHHLLRSLELETEEQIRHSYELEHGKPAIESSNTNSQFDPLEMDQYSEIQQLSRFIQEGLNDLGSIEKNLSSEHFRIKRVLKQQSQISREMQQELLATRLTEVSVILPRLRRIARQTASNVGKEISFEVEGEECELDRVVLQKITSPLEHILRNAVSHGVELPTERTTLNKPVKGKIQFTVQRDGAEIVMILSDDGQGIDKKEVYQKAVKMGIIPKNKKLTDNEIFRLTFHAGLSTTESLDQISGRGVGMDVAYSDIKNMGGSLHVDSNSQGTKFTIRLPLTLATNQVLMVEVAGEQYGIPMSGVVALQRVPNQQLQTHFDTDKPEITYNKKSYRLQHLSNVLKQPMTFDGNIDEKSPILFLNVDKQRIAYRLDKIIGNREVVIKPLSSLLHTSQLYSSATIQTDGKVVLILNTSELVYCNDSVIDNTESKGKEQVVDEIQYSTVMVVDDSITIRKVTESLLESHSYQVITAKDGMHALEKLNSYKPDIMLLDIEMPRMDGFELLSNLRNSEEWKYLPVIMISSRTGEKHRNRAEELGISQFLGKPYQEAVLLESISEILELKKGEVA